MSKEHRLRLTAEGLILPRALSEEDAILLGYDLRARRAALGPHIPDDLRARFDGVLDRIDAHTAALEEARKLPTPTPGPPQPPEALLALGSVLDLQRLAFVNTLEDHEVGAVATFLDVKARGTGAPAQAAQRLRDAWFPDGRAFLRRKSRDQWFAVHERFQNLSPEQEADLQTLGIQEDIARIQEVNRWHGALLRIHAAPLPAPQAATNRAILSAVEQEMILAIALAQLAWRDNPEARELLLGRYLSLIVYRTLPQR
jgi:hypothetical protein